MGMGGGVFFFIIINAVNLVNVRLYGETEFWFALIKVLAIIGMIGFGLWLLFSGHGGEHASIDNLWRYNGFFATGWHGLLLSLAVIMFSFGGLELIGITAAEARDPQKKHPESGESGGIPYFAVLHRFAGGVAGALSVGRGEIQ